VEGMDTALARSHDEGEDGEGQEVETEVPRAAEAGLYTEGVEGRLCSLVRAQQVCALQTTAAPGASESECLCQRSPSDAAHCHLI
ncbi:hypothetical protein POSPLADRAFT_1139513, partial [Postia placenta MAD-698-R-SB12]